MEYVSIAGIFKDITQKASDNLLSTLEAQDPNITGIRFEHGHYLEIAKRLEILSKGSLVDKQSKWPLIGLFRDFPETPQVGQFSQIKVTLFIAMWSEPNLSSDEREQQNFIPILFPIYNEILEQIDNDIRFQTTTVEEIDHTKIDHYYWGSQTVLDKGPNIFNQWTDSIELQNLTLIVNQKNC